MSDVNWAASLARPEHRKAAGDFGLELPVFNICFVGGDKGWQALGGLVEVLRDSLETNGFPSTVSRNELQANKPNILIGATIFLEEFPFEILDNRSTHRIILYQIEALHPSQGF